MRNRLATFLVITIVAAALIGGFVGGRVNAESPLEDESKDLLKTFTEVFATVQKNYVRDVSSDVLVENAIRGMLRTLDPHSSFFSTRDYDRLQEEQKGKYYGLGITIRSESPGSGRVVVVEPPVPGTPAFKAGMRAGDVIAKIRGAAIDDWDLNSEVIPNLKGPKGTTVDITVERPGEDEPLEFTVERDEIPLYTIKYAFRIRPNYGYVRISRFAETTGRELDQALEDLGEADLEGLILDLRDNPGGALTQALEVSDRFLDRGQRIVSTRTRTGRDNRDYAAKRTEQFAYSMVVLINRNSASASEIVAGALQDHDRAFIIGETSFGKALVQTIFPLEGNRGLALTTGKYYTPSDRLIQRDYSESFWEYYNSRSEQAKGSREKFYTDGGRTVYGGGGITPDEDVELGHVSKTARQIDRKSLFRKFASKLNSGAFGDKIEELGPLAEEDRERAVEKYAESENLYQSFKAYIEENGIDVSASEFEESEEVVRNLLRQEILLLLVGDEARYRIGLELDSQVQRAISVLPEVRALLETSMSVSNR